MPRRKPRWELCREGVQLRQSEANALEWFQGCGSELSRGQYQVGREYGSRTKRATATLTDSTKPIRGAAKLRNGVTKAAQPRTAVQRAGDDEELERALLSCI